MGMAASQARYLQLTSRKSDLEYEAQQICQRRLALADSTNAVATDYTKKVSDRRMYFIKPGTTFGSSTAGLSRVTYSDITSSYEDGGMGMRVVDANGKVVVAGLPQTLPDGSAATDYTIDLSCLSADALEAKLRSGDWFIQKQNTDFTESTDEWENANWTTNPYVYDALYTDNDPTAEAEYTAKSAHFQHEDKLLELRLNQVITQQKAIDTELDSVKKVLDKNVETTFKTFG